MAAARSAMVTVLMIAGLVHQASAVIHAVPTWKVTSPNISVFDDWAAQHTFSVGDTLLFTWSPSNAHNVYEVTKDDLASCSVSNGPVNGNMFTSSPASVPLATAGDHYYLCQVTGHCSLGMKMTITVVGSGNLTAPAASPGPKKAPTATSPITSPTASPSDASGLGSAAAMIAGVSLSGFVAIAMMVL